MSIFEDQKRGHSANEDRLTSAVFGTLDVVNRDVFLAEFLRRCGINHVDDTWLRALKFNFWESTGRRRPDVIMKTKGRSPLISIECKLDSALTASQLADEYRDVADMDPVSCWLIAVSADRRKPDAIDKTIGALSRSRNGHSNPRVVWTNWQTIHDIFSCGTHFENDTERRLVEEARTLLARKGLTMFTGFGADQLRNARALAEVWPDVDSFLNQCSAFFDTLNTDLRGEHFHTSGEPEPFSLGVNEVEGWMGIDAWHDGWAIPIRKDGKTKNKWPANQCLTAHLHLKRDSRTVELIVGYDLRFERDQKLKRRFAAEASRKALAQRLEQEKVSVMFWQYEEQDTVRYRTAEPSDLNADVFSMKDEDYNAADNVTLGCAFSLEDLEAPDILAKTEECITRVGRLIEDNGLFFGKLARFDT